MMLVFVYGTLKGGEPNYHWLTNTENGQAKFLCTGKLALKYPLVIASRYNIPFLLDSPGSSDKNVEGEVYEIDDKMLASLDILEEYPKLYTRRQEVILVAGDLNDGEIKAWVYFLTSFRPELLTFPHLSSYSSEGDHKLQYVARYIRDHEVDHRPEVKIMT